MPDENTVDGVTHVQSVERKRVKNVNARLRGDTLHVSAPPGIAPEELEQIVGRLARNLVRRAHAREANTDGDLLKLARKVAGRFPKAPGVERVTFVAGQRSSWGSYSPKTRTVRLNAALRGMPRWVLEAVVAHELAHAVHPDHSPAFWDLLRRACPQTDRANGFLHGVSWLCHNWERLPAVERALLPGVREGG